MEDVDRIRQLYQETGSCRKVAHIMGISRNTVTKYLNKIEDCQNGKAEEIIPSNRNIKRTKPVCNEKIKNKIHTYLEENQKKPKNQQLNALQIFKIINYEGTEISYSTVRREVRRWKHNNVFRDVCIAQDYESGYRGKCDWGQVYLKINEKKSKFSLIALVLNNSLYRFGRVYPNESQTNLFHALIELFHEIGGVPENIFFDNMKTVVTDSSDKVFNERFLQFAGHYGFQTNACNPASPQEKGTVEKSVSVIRTAAFGYRDSFSSLKEANEYLKKILSRINSSQVAKRDCVPLEGLEMERESFLPLPSMDFCPYDLKYRKVDRYSTVTFERNFYSVPESCKSEMLALKVYFDTIEILEGETVIATHERFFGKNECSLNIEHYLSTLRNKPGALRSSKVLKRADPCFKDLFMDHYQDKAKDFIKILSLIKEKPQTDVANAIKTLFEEGMIPDYESIRLILNFQQKPVIDSFSYPLDIDIPEPNLAVYDEISSGESRNG